MHHDTSWQHYQNTKIEGLKGQVAQTHLPVRTGAPWARVPLERKHLSLNRKSLWQMACPCFRSQLNLYKILRNQIYWWILWTNWKNNCLTIAWASSSASCQPSDPKSAQGPDYLGAKCCIQACCRSRCQTSGWWYGGISGSSHSVSFTFPSTNGPQTKPGQIGPGRINFIVSTWPTR